MEAILCQDRPQTEFSSLHKSHTRSVRGNIGNKFTLYPHFLCPSEFYVVYNLNYIIFSAQMGLREQKKDDVLFFSSLWQQPTNQGPVRHSDARTPLWRTRLNQTLAALNRRMPGPQANS